jgi:hypothetical protein
LVKDWDREQEFVLVEHEQWQRIETDLPTDVRGVERQNNRRIISGIIHMLKSRYRWPTGLLRRSPIARSVSAARHMGNPVQGARRQRSIDGHPDSTHVKAHRSAAGGKAGEQKQAIGRSRGSATKHSSP